MAVDYGCLPQTILALPWVQLKRLLESADRRRQRNWKLQTLLRNLEVAQNMQSMFGGAPVASAPAEQTLVVGDRVLDLSTKATINEQRDGTDPEGAGQKSEAGDSDDFLFWVKMKAQGYPVTLIDKKRNLVS